MLFMPISPLAGSGVLPFLALYLVLPFLVGTPCAALVGAGAGLRSGHLALGRTRGFRLVRVVFSTMWQVFVRRR